MATKGPGSGPEGAAKKPELLKPGEFQIKGKFITPAKQLQHPVHGYFTDFIGKNLGKFKEANKFTNEEFNFQAKNKELSIKGSLKKLARSLETLSEQLHDLQYDRSKNLGQLEELEITFPAGHPEKDAQSLVQAMIKNNVKINKFRIGEQEYGRPLFFAGSSGWNKLKQTPTDIKSDMEQHSAELKQERELGSTQRAPSAPPQESIPQEQVQQYRPVLDRKQREERRKEMGAPENAAQLSGSPIPVRETLDKNERRERREAAEARERAARNEAERMAREAEEQRAREAEERRRQHQPPAMPPRVPPENYPEGVPRTPPETVKHSLNPLGEGQSPQQEQPPGGPAHPRSPNKEADKQKKQGLEFKTETPKPKPR